MQTWLFITSDPFQGTINDDPFQIQNDVWVVIAALEKKTVDTTQNTNQRLNSNKFPRF